MPEKGEYVKFKNYKRGIKSPFMIFLDFESIPVSENNRKQNPDESCMNKYQKHVSCSYVSYINNCFKSYIGEDAVNHFVNSMIKESKYHTDIMKKHFKKELVMTKKGDEDFENPTKCCIFKNVYVDGDVKVRGHCHMTGKYRGSAHSHCNVKVKLNHKTLVVLHNLKHYDSHLIMQELGKFNLKVNVIPNGKYPH